MSDSEMDAIAAGMQARVRNQACPRCGYRLVDSQIRVRVTLDLQYVGVQWACTICGVTGRGMVELDDERRDKLARRGRLALLAQQRAAQMTDADPISVDDVLDLRLAFQTDDWWLKATGKT